MSTPLLATKFNLPATGAKFVQRTRLERTLDESLEQGVGLVLVCGPAGYGKTTLVSQWVRSASQGHLDSFTWLTLERSDDDLTRFLSYFITALRQVRPGFGEPVLKMLQTHKQQPPVALATMLINEFSTMTGRIVLVLDDFHLLISQSIQSFFTFLVDHLPPQLCLVLVTRSDPSIPSPRLRARGQLVEVRQHDLCFTLEEAASLLNQIIGLALTPQQVAVLEQQTEGWISGLQLAAISMRDVQDRQAFLAAFSGEHEFISDYLTDEVLARLPQADQDFLLQTSILERLTAPLCEAVTGQKDAQATLEHLIDDNLFIIPLDSQRKWYRYHVLFADLLRKRLNASGADMVGELHLRAAGWLEQHDLPEQAIEHAIAGNDFARAIRLIEQMAESLLPFGQAATLLRWLEALPNEQILTAPCLGALYGITLILCGRPIRSVAELLEKMSTFGSLDQPHGEVDMLQALLAVYQGDAARTIQLAKSALQRIPPERHFFRSLAADALGMGYTLAWDIPAATRAFEQVVEISSQSDNLMMTILAMTNLSGLHYVQGQLRSAIAICRQILDMARQRIGVQAPMLGKTLFNLGEMLREQGNLEAAQGYLIEAARMMEAFSEIGLPVVNLALARIYLNKGDWQTAQSYIDKARQYAQATQNQLMDDRLVEALQARLWLSQGSIEQANSWARSRGFIDQPANQVFAEAARNPAFYEVFQGECMVLVRLLLAQKHTTQALDFINLLQEQAEKRRSVRRLIELLALKSLALHQKGDIDQALLMLEQALSMAEPEGYLRTFVDEGQPMAKLLYRAAERGIYPEYSGRLLAALYEDQSHPPAERQPSEPLVEPLSERELEVLRLVAEGLSNGEIAGKLYISLSTVKGHTSNIFGKLGVKNRTQAVTRARSLGLLPPA